MLNGIPRVRPALISTILALAGWQATFAVFAFPRAQERGMLSGVVVSQVAAGAIPVGQSEILVLDAEAGTQAGQTMTDDSGQFSLPVAPGRYLITARKPYLLSGVFGAMTPNQAGIPVVVGAGQFVRELTISLFRGAVVAGTITDSAGDPMVGVSISAVNASTLDYEDAKSTVADSQGRFRLVALRPATYLIVAHAASEVGFVRSSRRHFYGPAYFPTGTATTPVTLELSDGQEMLGVDFAIQPIPATELEVRLSGLPDRYRGLATVSIRGASPGTLGITRLVRGDLGSPLAAVLPEGDYDIAAEVQPNPPASVAVTYWTSERLAVGGPTKVVATLGVRKGLTVTGRVKAPSIVSRPVVRLVPQMANSSPTARVFEATVGSDGAFTLANVPPGPYHVRVGAADLVSSEVAVEGRVVHGPVVLDRDVAENQLLVSIAAPARLQGAARDGSGNGVSGVHILVFSTDPLDWNPESGRVAWTRTDTTGVFIFSRLPAGAYKLAVLHDPDFGRRFVGAEVLQSLSLKSNLIPLSLAAAEKRTLDLQLPRLW